LKFTLAASTTLRFKVDWDGANGANPDVDVYACPGTTTTVTYASCYEDGGNAAGGAKPENTGYHTYTAGTHYLGIEFFAACDGATCPNSGSSVNNFKISVTRK